MNGRIHNRTRTLLFSLVAAAAIAWPSTMSDQGPSTLAQSKPDFIRKEDGELQPSSQPCHVVDAEDGRLIPTDNGVQAVVFGAEWKVTAGAVVKVGCDDGLVRAYANGNPFPPLPLQPLGNGDYLLTGSAGSHWTVEIMRQAAGRWQTELIEVVLGTGDVPAVPEEPVSDPQPSDDAFRAALGDWLATRMEPKRDPTTARILVDAWRRVVETHTGSTDLQMTRRAIVVARQQVMNERKSFDTDWRPFLLELSDLIDRYPPETATRYLAAIRSVCNLLDQTVRAISHQNDTKANVISSTEVEFPNGDTLNSEIIWPAQIVPQREVNSVPCPGGVCPMPSTPIFRRRFFR